MHIVSANELSQYYQPQRVDCNSFGLELYTPQTYMYKNSA